MYEYLNFHVFSPPFSLLLLCLYSYLAPTATNVDFFQVPLTLSPATGRRLDYTIFSVDIGVTDVT